MSTKEVKTDIGKVLEKLRIDYRETQAKQGKRLGLSQSFLSFITTGRRNFSFEAYKKILECYDVKEYRDVIDIELIKKDVMERLRKVVPEITAKQAIYILYGEYIE